MKQYLLPEGGNFYKVNRLFVNSWGEKNLTRTKKAGKVRSKSVTERSEVALLLYGAAVFVGEHKEYSIAKAFEIMQAIGIAL